MNHYAYVYIGIAESTTFFGASIDASQLLNTREKETIVNDLLIAILLIIGKLLCGVLVCIVGILSTDWGWAHDIDNVKVSFFLCFELGTTTTTTNKQQNPTTGHYGSRRILLWIFYRIDFYITCGQRCDHSIRFVCLGTRCI